jgi:hypothetical protein
MKRPSLRELSLASKWSVAASRRYRPISCRCETSSKGERGNLAESNHMGGLPMTKPAELYACLYAKEFPPSQPRNAMRLLRPPEKATVTLQNLRPTSFFFRERCYTLESAYGLGSLVVIGGTQRSGGWSNGIWLQAHTTIASSVAWFAIAFGMNGG